MGKPEIRPPAIPKPHNQSSPKFAHVITSGTCTTVQNYVTIHLGVSSPRHVNLHVKMMTLLLIFYVSSSNSLQKRAIDRFSREIRQTTRFRARMCMLWVRIEIFNIQTPYYPKTATFGPDFDRT